MLLNHCFFIFGIWLVLQNSTPLGSQPKLTPVGGRLGLCLCCSWITTHLRQKTGLQVFFSLFISPLFFFFYSLQYFFEFTFLPQEISTATLIYQNSKLRTAKNTATSVTASQTRKGWARGRAESKLLTFFLFQRQWRVPASILPAEGRSCGQFVAPGNDAWRCLVLPGA